MRIFKKKEGGMGVFNPQRAGRFMLLVAAAYGGASSTIRCRSGCDNSIHRSTKISVSVAVHFPFKTAELGACLGSSASSSCGCRSDFSADVVASSDCEPFCWVYVQCLHYNVARILRPLGRRGIALHTSLFSTLDFNSGCAA